MESNKLHAFSKKMYQELLTNIKKRDIGVRLAIALVAAVLIVYFYPHPESTHYNYEEGRPWNYAKLIAPFDIPIHPDSNTIRAARDSLTARFVPVYQLNQLLGDTVVRDLPKSPGNNYRDRVARQLRNIYATGVVDAATREQIEKGELPKVRILDKNVLSEMSTSGFISPRDIYARLDSTVTDPGLRQYISAARLAEILRPNIVYDEAESRRHFDYDYLTLTADRGVIQQGQTIIDKGAIVSPQDFTNLMTYEAMLKDSVTKDSKSDWLMLLGQFVYVVMLLVILCVYVYIYCRAIYTNLKAFLFIISVVTFFFLMAVALNTFIPSGIYIVPMTIVPILVLVFFDGRTALFVSTVTTMICAGITSFPLEFIFLQISAAAAAVLFSQAAAPAFRTAAHGLFCRGRLSLVLCGARTAYERHLRRLFDKNGHLPGRQFAADIDGLCADVCGRASLRFRLGSDTCRAGRCQHTAAATSQRRVSGHVPALDGREQSRVGGGQTHQRQRTARARRRLYHDVGKLVNPAFFTENQHGVNPHDALTPVQSARIVINHVNDGLRLADKAGLHFRDKEFHHRTSRQRHGQILLYHRVQGSSRRGRRPGSVYLSGPDAAVA